MIHILVNKRKSCGAVILRLKTSDSDLSKQQGIVILIFFLWLSIFEHRQGWIVRHLQGDVRTAPTR